MISNLAKAPVPCSSSGRRQTSDYLTAAGFAVWRNDPRIDPFGDHNGAVVELSYLPGGQMFYLHGGAWRIVEAGHLAVFWRGMPHHTLTSGDTTGQIRVRIPLPWLLQWNLPRDLAGRLLAGDFFQFPIATEQPERWLRDAESGDAERQAVLLLELHATLGRVALELSCDGSWPAPQAGPTGGDQHVQRAAAFVAAHYRDGNLSLEVIARAVNLRPHYLTSLFKRRCHASLWDYVTRLRVSHAQCLLIRTDLKVLDLALESGFNSLASFYIAFTRQCGMRPLAFRRQKTPAA